MKKLVYVSSFKSLPVTVFWYPSEKKTPHTILLLKGLYGFHDPSSLDSWDVDIIKKHGDTSNFIVVNTARKTSVDVRSKESFAGKTFRQECDDIWQSYQLLEKEGVFSTSCALHIIANSFGGTTLLGIPELVEKAISITMIGSGCGKSDTTTKPLLATLFDEKTLLQPLRTYKGIFIFVRGSNDIIVPKASQEKIVKNAISASAHIKYTINDAQHDLSPTHKGGTVMGRTNILSSILHGLVPMTRGEL